MSDNSRSRKYLLTINNPQEHGFTHEKIKDTMLSLKWSYYCMCDEIGASGTMHTHLFFYCENAVSFGKIKKLFNTAHIDKALGSAGENRDYIRKEGKYQNSEKKETNIPETFEEYGEIPKDKDEKNKNISATILEMIESGASTTEIIKEYPSYLTKINHIETARQTLLSEQQKNIFRDIMVTYIWGDSRTGKTRYVLEKYGYDKVYKISNYEHPFDNYKGERVILFDEFRSGIPITDMLQYLDGYPCRLSARYSDKIACYTDVYIVSNVAIDRQYPNKQIEEPQTYNAFVNRITRAFKFERNEKNPVEPIKTEEIPESYLM